MELVRCEDEREDTTLEDRHLLFADLTFGKLSEDFEVSILSTKYQNQK